jgi:glutaredoxin
MITCLGRCSGYRSVLVPVFWLCGFLLLTARIGLAQPPQNTRPVQAPPVGAVRCVAMELYLRSSQAGAAECETAVRAAIDAREGVRLRVYDLDKQPQDDARLQNLIKVYKLPAKALPVLYALNQALEGDATPQQWGARVDDLLRVEVFVRTGCPRCDAAKKALPALERKYPGLIFDVQDVVFVPQANQRFAQLARSQGIGGVSFPGFWLCRQLLIGFDGNANSLARLEAVLKRWTLDCQPQRPQAPPRPAPSGLRVSPASFGVLSSGAAVKFVALLQADTPEAISQDSRPQDSRGSATGDEFSQAEEDGAGLPIGDEVGLPIGDEVGLPIETAGESDDAQTIELPWFGQISAGRLGMPLFTILIGLVDGFNPCAMWVLLFLLSVLVNLRDRWKILAVAGTFVVISGLAYFMFMAAWLNVFLWVGILRWVQVALATLAIVVGTIHIKDFFALHQGISLSIPESAKPGIYARVRGIVMAESLVGAIVGATILAVLVNMVELLCTAGLPALYSQVLAMREYPAWKNYAYLALYILAYMFDDALMVAVVVITLGKRKLQEHEGRWLKLVSGLVVLGLGLVLLLRPEWLVY